MGVTPPIRYIHIDDYSPVGIDNGPDDAAFANARADLAASGFHTLVIGRKQYWLQNGFNLNSYTDYSVNPSGNLLPALHNVLITSDSFSGGSDSSAPRFFTGLPGTIILSPGFADPTSSIVPLAYAYSGGSEPYRTTGSIQLANSCGLTNLRIMSLAAYQYCLSAANGLDTLPLANALIWGPGGTSMQSAVGVANGQLYVPAGGGTAIQIDGDFCYLDNLVILGFRNQIVGAAILGMNPTTGGPGAPRIGWTKTDAANGIRIDGCEQAGALSGPLENLGLMTTKLGSGTNVAPFQLASGSGTSCVGTVTITNSNDPGVLAPSSFAVGAPLKISLTGAMTSGAVYSPYNTANATAAGVPSNRFDAYVVSATALGTGTLSLEFEIPGISLGSLYDVTCTQSASCFGTIKSGTLYASGINGFLSPGQLVSGSGVGAGVYVTDIVSATSSTATCTVSSSSVSVTTGLTLQPGATVVGSITSTGVNSLGAQTLSITGTVSGVPAVGQLLTDGDVIPGTEISAYLASPGGVSTWQLAVPQNCQNSLINAFSGAVAIGGASGISGNTLSLSSIMAGTAAVGQLVIGNGIPLGTTISAGSGPSYSITNNSLSLNPTASDEHIYLLNLSAVSVTMNNSSGVTTIALVGGGTIPLSVGEAIFGANVVPGSFVETSIGSLATVGVLLDIGASTYGSTTAPAIIVAQSGALIEASVGHTDTSSTTITVTTIAGAITQYSPLLGAGLTPNTYFESVVGPVTLNNEQQVPNAEIMASPSGVVATSSISGTVLTVYSSSGTTALTASQILNHPNISPGTSIAQSIVVAPSTSLTAAGLYSIDTPQYTQSGGILSFVPVAAAQGSISGTILTISPTGTLAVGQYVTGNGLSPQTVITGATVDTSGNVTYSLSPAGSSSVGVFTAGPVDAMAEVTIGNTGPSTLMSISSMLFGTVTPGQLVSGPGISAPTFITSTTSSPTVFNLSNPCFVNPPEVVTLGASTSSVFVGSLSALSGPGLPHTGSLMVSSVISGAIGLGHVLIGGDLPSSPNIYISSCSGSASGVTTYTVTQPTGAAIHATNPAIMASVAAPATFIGTLSSGSLIVPPVSPMLNSVVTGSGVADDTVILGQISTSNSYSVTVAQSVGGALNPEMLTFTASSTSQVGTGAIAGSTLTITNALLPPLAPGMQVIGPGVIPNTTVGTTLSASQAIVYVPQALSTTPIIVPTQAAVISGSIVGKVLNGTVLNGTAAVGMLLTGPGIPIGTTITNLPGGGTGLISGTVSVQQYASGTITVYGSGVVCVGSITGTSLTLSANSHAPASGQLLLGAGVLAGTNITSTGSTYSLAVAQPSGSQTLVLSNPLYSSSGTLPTNLNLSFSATNVRPGRYIELNNSASWSITDIQCFNSSTVVKLIDSAGVVLSRAHVDCNPGDMNTTFVDIQGVSTGLVCNALTYVDIFTFINNNAQQGSVLSTNLQLVGCSGSVTEGGTLVLQTGNGMLASGCNFGRGLINIQSNAPVSFSSSEFAVGTTSGAGTIGIVPTQFQYGTGVSSAVFDPSCQNAP